MPKPLTLLLLLALLILTGCASIAEPDSPAACEVNPPEEPKICTMQYDPVCGCDGKTYPNACAAGAAGVSESSPGICEKDDLR